MHPYFLHQVATPGSQQHLCLKLPTACMVYGKDKTLGSALLGHPMAEE